jgi:hypothetical protein
MTVENKQQFRSEQAALKEKLIYLSDNYTNLSTITLPHKKRLEQYVHSRFFERTVDEKDGAFFDHIGINHEKITRFKQQALRVFFNDLENNVNQFVAIQLFPDWIDILHNENKYQLEFFHENNLETRYLLDTKSPHDLNDYKSIEDFLVNNHDDTDNNPDPYNNMETLERRYLNIFTDYIHDCFLDACKKVLVDFTQSTFNQKLASKYSDNNNQNYKPLNTIAKSYFKRIIHRPIKDIFVLFNNKQHREIYQHCLKQGEISLLHNQQLELAEKNVQMFIETLNKKGLVQLKIICEHNVFHLNVGTATAGDNNALANREIRTLLLGAMTQNMTASIVCREFSPLKINNQHIEIISSVVIHKQRIIAIDKVMLRYNYLNMSGGKTVRPCPEQYLFKQVKDTPLSQLMNLAPSPQNH